MVNSALFGSTMKGLVTAFVICTHLVAANLAAAQDDIAKSGPREVVAAATDNIMTLAREAPEYFDTDPERYTSAVGEELDRVVDFLSMDGNFLRSIDSQTDLVSPDIYNGDHDVIADHDAFVSVPRQDQHGWLLKS